MSVLSYICALACFFQGGNLGTELHPGNTVHGLLNPGVSQHYLLTLESGTVAELVLQQGGADLVATILSPNGDRLIVDERENGPEPILIDASVAGLYQLEVSTRAKISSPISYQLTADEFRLKRGGDDLRLEAQRLSTNAKQLSAGNASSLRQAVDLSSKALELQRQAGDRKAEAALLVQSGAYLLQLSELDTARAQLTQGLSLARDESERWVEGSALNNLGVLHWQAGEFSETIHDLSQAMAIWKELGYKYGEAATLNNLGLRYRAMGAYQEASKSYRQAFSLLIALGDKAHAAYAYNNLGVVQSSLAEDSEALVSFRNAARLYHDAGNSKSEALTLIHIARTYAAGGHIREARTYLEQALPLAQKADDDRSTSDGLKLLGDFQAADGRQQVALEDYEKALTIYRRISIPAGEAAVLQSIGELYNQMGKTDAAFNYLSQALAIQHTLGLRDGEAETLFQLARVEQEKAELTSARDHIESALKLIESVRALVAGPQFRMSYLASKNQYYSFACDLYRQLDRQTPGAGFAQRGFELSERSRARSLLDLLAEAQAGIGKELRPDLAAHERRLHEELNVLADSVAKLSKENDSQKLEVETKKLDAALSEYYELESEIRDFDPRYMRLAPLPTTAEEVQKSLLDANTVLFEYTLGTKSSELWVLTPDSMALFELPGRAAIEQAASRFFQALKKSGHPENSAPPETLTRAGQALSRMILPPASVVLGRKRILIVGDDILQRLPFDVLPERKSNEPLIEEHEIVFLPSASVLVAERNEARARRLARGTIAVVADPVFDAGDARTAKPASGVTPAFPRLPFSRREAETILSLGPREKSFRALDFSASRSLFFSGQLAGYKMVHVATHAVVDSARPELSELVFSLVDKNGKSVDGRLRLHEIASLRLPASLVTLSACGTALGHDVRGEGTVGFARGFIRSGAATVVVSLWDVEDESTSELMKLFYSGILGPRHLAPAAALREAQRTMSHNSRWTPYQWSGWLVIGDWR